MIIVIMIMIIMDSLFTNNTSGHLLNSIFSILTMKILNETTSFISRNFYINNFAKWLEITKYKKILYTYIYIYIYIIYNII